ncbi:MAG: glycosyltransferase family 87 protein [Hyphomonadaceae bacterium]
MPLTRRFVLIGASLAALATLAAMASQLIGANGMHLANGQPLFGDYFAFWSAGRMALEGAAADAYTQSTLFEVQRRVIPELTVVFPFRHPPAFLFLAAPLSLLPLPLAASLFLIAGFALFIYAARFFASRASDIAIAAMQPAALLHIGSVQLGLFVAGVTGLAVAWLKKRPRAAGIMIGLLALKPHLALLWPILLIAQKRWSAFLSAAITAIALTIAAGIVFGWETYPRFIEAVLQGESAVSAGRINHAPQVSLYANLIGLGVPIPFAMAIHALSAAAAIFLSILIWRGNDERTSAAALVSATLLISPYLFFYDHVMILIAIAALHQRASVREQWLLAFAWLASGLALALGNFLTLPVAPLACWAVLLIAANRAGIQVWMKRGSSPSASTTQVSAPP